LGVGSTTPYILNLLVVWGVTDRFYAPYLSRPQSWSENDDGKSLCPFLGIETRFLDRSLRSAASLAAFIVRGFRNARNGDD
jgi:hypothetical protein